VGLDCLVFEKADDVVCTHRDRGHQTLRSGLLAVLTANEYSGPGTQWACDYCVRSSELDDIGDADTEQLGPEKSLVGDGLQAIVVCHARVSLHVRSVKTTGYEPALVISVPERIILPSAPPKS
jgi:hypothetical protein